MLGLMRFKSGRDTSQIPL